MNRPLPGRGGAGGVALVLCVAAALFGLGFDFVIPGSAPFWIGDAPGGSAAIGAAAAVFCLGASRLVETFLRRRDRD